MNYVNEDEVTLASFLIKLAQDPCIYTYMLYVALIIIGIMIFYIGVLYGKRKGFNKGVDIIKSLHTSNKICISCPYVYIRKTQNEDGYKLFIPKETKEK